MKILLTILLLFPLTLLAQSFQLDSASGKISYHGKLNVEGKTKEELYTRAREWFALNFRSADKVLDMDDKDSGVLIGKAFSNIEDMSTNGMPNMKIWYTIKVKVEDNLFQYAINNIHLQNYINVRLGNPEAQTQMIPGEKFLLGSDKTAKGKVNTRLVDGRNQARLILEDLNKALRTQMTTKSDF